MSVPLWDTNDGQKWLAKAIDPAGMNVDLKGMPDQETHNVVVLNYQSQFAVSPPNMFGAAANDGSTFESEMYFYQHPYIFGVSASYPTGTVDPLSTNRIIALGFGSNPNPSATPATVGSSPFIAFNSNGVMFPRTCQTFVNTQIAGNASIRDVATRWGELAQKHRVIYGAAQAIPTCSAQDNSGSISVSQQPFIGDDTSYRVVDSSSLKLNLNNTILNVANGDNAVSNRFKLPVKAYRDDDFPSSEDNIRNPASLLTRFYEGAYIPYKLKNPFHEDFITSDNKVATLAPYWVIGASYKDHNTQSWFPLTWDMASSSFTTPMTPEGTNRVRTYCDRLCLRLMSKMGQEIDLVFVNTHGEVAEPTPDLTHEYLATIDLQNPYKRAGEDVRICLLNDLNAGDNLLSTVNSNKYITCTFNDEPSYANLHCYRVNPQGQAVCDFPSDNVVAVLCKAMNMRGNITLLFRLGVEIQVTGASTYSPFNHKSPAYDESAIKSYLRIVHQMSDGFYGNAASDLFHNAYYEWFMTMLYNPPSDVDFANKGSYWRGAIRA